MDEKAAANSESHQPKPSAAMEQTSVGVKSGAHKNSFEATAVVKVIGGKHLDIANGSLV